MGKQGRLEAFFVPVRKRKYEDCHHDPIVDDDPIEREKNDVVEDGGNTKGSNDDIIINNNHMNDPNDTVRMEKKESINEKSKENDKDDVRKSSILNMLQYRRIGKNQKNHLSKSQIMFQMQHFASRSRFGLCKSVRLNHHHTKSDHSVTGSISCLEFDSEGVLLACADSTGVVSLFDFDELHARDLKYFNRLAYSSTIADKAKRKEHKPRTCDLEPFLRFRAAGASGQSLVVSSIKWNPRNEDQIAVSFLNTSRVIVYDVGVMSDPTFTPNGRAIPHINVAKQGDTCGTKSILFSSKRVQARKRGKENQGKKGISSIVVTRLLTGSNYGILRLWTLPKEIRDDTKRNSSKMVWEYSVFHSIDSGNSEAIVDMALLGPDSRGIIPISGSKYSGFLLIAGSKGSIRLLDIEQCTKKAFSTALSPTVLRSWSLPKMQLKMFGRSTIIKNTSFSGIQKISVWSLSNEIDTKSNSDRSSVLTDALINCDVLIETKCGWLLRLDVSHQTRRNLAGATTNVAHASLSIVHKIDSTQHLYTRPICRMACGRLFAVATRSRQVLIATPRIEDRILVYRHERSPDENEVIPSNLSIINSCSSNNEEKVMLNFSLRAEPTAIASHPRSDWMIVGHENGTLELLALRRGRKFQQPKTQQSSLIEVEDHDALT